MPAAKRKSTESSTAPSKQAKATNTNEAPEGDPPRNPRWSKVSGSGNADDQYLHQDKTKKYSWVCLCKRQLLHVSERGDEDENCDPDGPACHCMKPIEDYPNDEWVVNHGAFTKAHSYALMTPLRDPDMFGMHTWSKGFAYGVIEIFENVLLDFDEAKDNWKEQWVICQGVMIWCYRGFGDEAERADDGEQVAAVAATLRTMFLSMLANFERLGFLHPNSEVKNLGIMMGLYLELAEAGNYGNVKAPLSYDETDIGEVILAYANKYNIVLKTPKDNSALIAKLQTKAAEVTLPLSDAEHTDPWNWAGDLKDYSKTYSPEFSSIGGDKCDITTWMPSERKNASLNGKDPIPRSTFNKPKEGLVMALA